MENRCGKTVELKIETLGSGGEGVARDGGKAVFVRFALPDETVRARITVDKPRYSEAELISVLSPSPARRVPVCPAFGRCGGCDLQHADYAAQLIFKTKKVADALRRLGGIDAEVSPCVASPKQLRYRNKFNLPVGRNANGEPIFGFYGRQSREIIPVTDCPLQPEWFPRLIEAAAEYSGGRGGDRSGLNHLTARASGGGVLISAVSPAGNLPDADRLYSLLCEKLSPLETGLYHNRNGSPGGAVEGGEYTHLHGLRTVTAASLGISAEIGPRSFFQVNPEVNALLQAAVIGEGFGPEDVAVDAYGGAGTLGALLALTGATVYGVEIVPEAVAAARALAHREGLSERMNFSEGDCGRVLPKLLPELRRKHPDKRLTLLLDPPRRGCDERALGGILSALPDRIIHVSCDPATLSRDLKFLLARTNGAYSLTKVQPFDMFPQTANVETLVRLDRK